MKVAAWILATIAALVVGHFCPAAYAAAAVFALLGLAETERGPDRRRWRDSRRAGDWRVR